MKLALRDIRYNLTRFVLTIAGVGLLMAATIGMVGMYRGIVFEALIIIDGVDADLWVVEGGRAGPFAELSAVPANLDRRVEGVPGVASVRRYIGYNQQYEIAGKTVRLAITGIDFPKDSGHWIPLVDGRHLQSTRYEAIADKSTGLSVGDRVKLNQDTYTIVGLASQQVDMAGDGMLFVSIADAQSINRMLPSEAVLLNRAAKGRTRMGLGDGGSIGAVIVELAPGASLAAVRETIARWGDVAVLSTEDQRRLLLDGRLGRLRFQILAFTTMTLLICCAVITLTIYTMTLEKTAQIALLKLIGARDRVISLMIVAQASMIGFCGLVVGVAISLTVFPHFPRTVLITPDDLAVLGLILMLLSLAASWVAIRKAMTVRAQEVLA